MRLISNGLGEDGIGAVIAADLKGTFQLAPCGLLALERRIWQKIPVLGPTCLGSSGNRRYKLSLFRISKMGPLASCSSK